jgi:hypothetical protein
MVNTSLLRNAVRQQLSKYDAAARASVDGDVAQSARIVLVDESAKQAAALASSRARRPDHVCGVSCWRAIYLN